eukprot:gb/GEZJ01005603.1/.p1 GENE.gb/GEZJ01005603.1/~~gb/GEZJ01005603.1/.p1  ORF type:complete len:170 (-),score=13.88 gb/GEZJ01005603.1/:604-1113(-)
MLLKHLQRYGQNRQEFQTWLDFIGAEQGKKTPETCSSKLNGNCSAVLKGWPQQCSVLPSSTSPNRSNSRHSVASPFLSSKFQRLAVAHYHFSCFASPSPACPSFDLPSPLAQRLKLQNSYRLVPAFTYIDSCCEDDADVTVVILYQMQMTVVAFLAQQNRQHGGSRPGR